MVGRSLQTSRQSLFQRRSLLVSARRFLEYRLLSHAWEGGCPQPPHASDRQPSQRAAFGDKCPPFEIYTHLRTKRICAWTNLRNARGHRIMSCWRFEDVQTFYSSRSPRKNVHDSSVTKLLIRPYSTHGKKPITGVLVDTSSCPTMCISFALQLRTHPLRYESG